MNVDLDHARVRRDAEHAQMWIARRRVALDGYRNMHCACHKLDRVEQRDVLVDMLERRHEDVKVALANLHRERRLDHLPRLVAACASGRWLPRHPSSER